MSEWQWVKLGDITTKIGSGATPRGGKEAYKTQGITLIRSLNVYDFYFDYAGLAFIDDDQANQLDNVIVESGDILLNITGASVARCCMVPDDVLPARVNQHVAIIRINPRFADPKYVYYTINSPTYKHHLLTLAQGGATREALTKSTIEEFGIPCPPLLTQRRIAAILSAYDDLIENNTRRIQALEQAAHDLYREWFVEFRFPGYESVPLVDSGTEHGMTPQGWGVLPVSQAIEINPRIVVVKDAEKPFIEMARLSESSMLIDTRDMEFRTSNNGSKFQNYDTLFARITPCLENGKTGYVNFLANGDVALGSTEFVVMRSGTLTPEYVYCLSRLSDFRAAAQKTMTGASGRQRVQNIFFDSYLIVQPSQDVLNEFQEIVAPLFDQISVLAQKNDALRETRDLLLPRLVSGDLDVSEVEVGAL